MKVKMVNCEKLYLLFLSKAVNLNHKYSQILIKKLKYTELYLSCHDIYIYVKKICIPALKTIAFLYCAGSSSEGGRLPNVIYVIQY